MRLPEILADRGHRQHAPAIGEDAAAVSLGAGMEDDDALLLARGIEVADLRAFLRRVGIALGRHDHGHRRLRVPAEIDLVELAVAGGDQRRQQV